MGLAFEQSARAGVDLLHDRDRADKAAPGFSAPEITDRQCGDDDADEEQRQCRAIGIQE